MITRRAKGFAVLGHRVVGKAQAALDTLRTAHPDMVHEAGGTTYVGVLIPASSERPSAAVATAAEARIHGLLSGELLGEACLSAFAVTIVETDIPAWMPQETAS